MVKNILGYRRFDKIDSIRICDDFLIEATRIICLAMPEDNAKVHEALK